MPLPNLNKMWQRLSGSQQDQNDDDGWGRMDDFSSDDESLYKAATPGPMAIDGLDDDGWGPYLPPADDSDDESGHEKVSNVLHKGNDEAEEKSSPNVVNDKVDSKNLMPNSCKTVGAEEPTTNTKDVELGSNVSSTENGNMQIDSAGRQHAEQERPFQTHKPHFPILGEPENNNIDNPNSSPATPTRQVDNVNIFDITPAAAPTPQASTDKKVRKRKIPQPAVPVRKSPRRNTRASTLK